jgi:hypothetical protein
MFVGDVEHPLPAVNGIAKYRHPSSAREWHLSRTAELSITGQQVVPPSYLQLSTSTSRSMVLESDSTQDSVTKRMAVNRHVAACHLDTHRRLSIDHSKLVLVPIEQQRSPAEDEGKFSCSCGRDQGHQVDHTCCRRFASWPNAEELRLDDEKRGRFHTTLLGAGFSSVRKTATIPLRLQPCSEGVRLNARKSVETLAEKADESSVSQSRRRQSSVSAASRQMSRRPSVRSSDTSAPTRRTTGPPSTTCVECEAVIAKRYGSVNHLMALARSRKSQADLVRQAM